MSTNFYVYPGKKYIPTFKELLDLGNININKYLARLGELRKVILDVELHNTKDHSKINFSVDDKAIWNEEHYAWFYIKGIQGGADSYNFKTTVIDKEVWQEECITNDKAKHLKQSIDRSLEIGYHWSFRRSAGQPGIINLLYGLLAASLAKSTDGFIYSDDGAWDYSCFPAIADDFLEWYFIPELASKSDDKEWVENSLKLIINELNQIDLENIQPL